MKQIFILLFILFSSSFSFAMSDKSDIAKRYERLKEEQRYRFQHEIRKEKHRGELRLIRAKYDRKVNRRYGHRRYSRRRYYNSYSYFPYSIYSLSNCR